MLRDGLFLRISWYVLFNNAEGRVRYEFLVVLLLALILGTSLALALARGLDSLTERSLLLLLVQHPVHLSAVEQG